MTDTTLRCRLLGHRTYVMDDYSRVEEYGFFEPVRRCRRCDYREPMGIYIRDDAKWSAYHLERMMLEEADD